MIKNKYLRLTVRIFFGVVIIPLVALIGIMWVIQTLMTKFALWFVMEALENVLMPLTKLVIREELYKAFEESYNNAKEGKFKEFIYKKEGGDEDA